MARRKGQKADPEEQARDAVRRERDSMAHDASVQAGEELGENREEARKAILKDSDDKKE